MKKDGHYYSKFLTEDELRRFKVNFIWDDWFFNREFDSFSNFIGLGFYWDISNEGHWYWATISKREVTDTFVFKTTRKHSMI